MKYRKLDENNDMTFGNQVSDFFHDVPDGVSQAIMTRLKMWAGEWFLNITEGTPYQAAILGNDTKQTIDPAIRARILETPGVISIDSLSVDFNEDDRICTISAIVSTIYGTATAQGAI